jgi:hypothetical protein
MKMAANAATTNNNGKTLAHSGFLGSIAVCLCSAPVIGRAILF